jgi:hypothetical protein
MMHRLAVLALLVGCSSSKTSTPDPDPDGEAMGCDGVPLRPNPADLAERGPWAVGARTVAVGSLTAEVWYPAPPDSAEGRATDRYDIREHLPAS